MEAARASEMSVDNYFTRQYIPEDKSELHVATCIRYNFSALVSWVFSGVHQMFNMYRVVVQKYVWFFVTIGLFIYMSEINFGLKQYSDYLKWTR
jgi:hypothetical protein